LYHNGFALSQKRKNISELHRKILLDEPESKILEISTKSPNPLGVRLSAFNLRIFNSYIDSYVTVESAFQSSKVFEFGGPFRNILTAGAKEAKQDQRLKTFGNLCSFEYENAKWPLEPKTFFYDWLYMSALLNQPELSEAILKYDTFTDIEFNHNKSINCQARTAAIFTSLAQSGNVKGYILNPEKLKSIYDQPSTQQEGEQLEIRL